MTTNGAERLADYSEIDSRRFGTRIYRAHLRRAADVPALEALARAERVEMVITRCPVALVGVAQALESARHQLMDTLVYYAGPTGGPARGAAAAPHPIRRAAPGDREALRAVADDCFAGYHGHYHADPRLDPALATLGYVDWCLSSLEAPGHTVWVAIDGERVVGFLTLVETTGGNGAGAAAAAEIRLNGVASPYRGRGVYDALFKHASRSLAEGGVRELQVSTQLDNFAPQRIWIRNGLVLRDAVYTFHKWFDP